jgi:hypothetical protein
MSAATAVANPAAPRIGGGPFSGAALAVGAVALFVGTLFYARLTPELGLPALPAGRSQALADAISAGAQRLTLAGGWAFLGDWLILGASVALVRRRRNPASDLESVGWALVAASTAIAMVFDSMTAALFWPLAHTSDSGTFAAFKAWFDFLFAAGNIPFGLGFIAVLWTDARSNSPLLWKPLDYFGIAVGAAAAISGIGYLTELAHFPLVIGLTVTVGCVVLTALGIQIARDGRTAQSTVGS